MKQTFKLRRSPFVTVLLSVCSIFLLIIIIYIFAFSIYENSGHFGYMFDLTDFLDGTSLPLILLLVFTLYILFSKQYICIEDNHMIISNMSILLRKVKLDEIIEITQLKETDERDFWTMRSSGCWGLKNSFSIVSRTKTVYVSIADCDLEDFRKFIEEINNKMGI